MRGVCYAHMYRGPGYGSPGSATQLAELRTLGVDWLSVTPFGFVASAASGAVEGVEEMMAKARAQAWVKNNQAQPETDEIVRAELALDKKAGFRTQLKPHLWMMDGSWRGKLHRDSPEAWAEFWASYEAWILHYAEMAAAEKVDMLVVGVELDHTTQPFEAEWRSLIAKVRARYDGLLTYSANWDAYERVPFWDALDYVGVQFYPPLADAAGGTDAAWGERLEVSLQALDRISERTGKAILLTEVGYRAVRGTEVSPHTWPDPKAREVDERAQARAYGVLFRGVARHPSVQGLFVWKWYTDPAGDEGPAGFSPRGYLAEAVLARAYGGKVPVRK